MSRINNTILLTGCHGTNYELLPRIKKDSLMVSRGRKHWFGDGCYFFCDGINKKPADELAKYWAIDQSWDNESKSYSYSEWIVIKCDFEVEQSEILDLTIDSGLMIFNEFRDQIIGRLFESNKKIKKGEYYDADVFDIMKQKLNLKVIFGNVFLKYAELRMFGLNLQTRVPNVTIFCIEEPNSDYINPRTLEVIKKGEISWT